jgi:hypothetical protein
MTGEYPALPTAFDRLTDSRASGPTTTDTSDEADRLRRENASLRRLNREIEEERLELIRLAEERQPPRNRPARHRRRLRRSPPGDPVSTITVTTQAELDAALVAADTEAEWTDIHIRSDAGVWLYLTRTPDSSSVVARGSSSVVARDSSSVVARGSSSVVALDSSSVVALDSSRVMAWDSSSVEALDSSSVVALDSSSVEALGSSSVEAWDSSSVEARGSSSVVAWDSSSVVARDSSSVEAGDYVAVHLHSARATIDGGVLIEEA